MYINFEGGYMKNLLFFFCGMMSLASEYRNGTYRGTFVSGQETQVEVQFNLKMM